MIFIIDFINGNLQIRGFIVEFFFDINVGCKGRECILKYVIRIFFKMRVVLKEREYRIIVKSLDINL